MLRKNIIEILLAQEMKTMLELLKKRKKSLQWNINPHMSLTKIFQKFFFFTPALRQVKETFQQKTAQLNHTHTYTFEPNHSFTMNPF